jgi:hypothetical protein
MDALQPLLNDKTADDFGVHCLAGCTGSLFEDDIEALPTGSRNPTAASNAVTGNVVMSRNPRRPGGRTVAPATKEDF